MKNRTNKRAAIVDGRCAGSEAAGPGETGESGVMIVRRSGSGDVVEADCFEGSAAITATEAQTVELTPAQRKAIELLTTGHTMAAAARAAGVNRGTLYRWFKNDAAFVSAYNGWQRDVVETARRRILALGELATSAIAKALLRGDAVTAREVLKSIGAMEREVKPIAVEPERAGRWLKVEEAKNEIVLKGAEDEVVLKEMGIE